MSSSLKTFKAFSSAKKKYKHSCLAYTAFCNLASIQLTRLNATTFSPTHFDPGALVIQKL